MSRLTQIERRPAPVTTSKPARRTPTAAAGIAGVLFIAVAVGVPAAASAFWLAAITTAVIYALPLAGVGILYGRLGIVSLCQVALFGVGAWTALRLGFGTNLPFEVIILLAGVATSLVGLLLGLATVRLSGLYFALVSLMAAGAVQVFLVAKGFPNGGDGLLGVTNGLQAQKVLGRSHYAESSDAYLRYALVVVTVLLVICWFVCRGRAGRAWALMRRSEGCARSVGVNVGLYKLLGIVLSSFITGAGGALLAGQVGSLNAATFYASDSAVLFAVALLGGAHSLTGAVIAAGAYQLLPAELTKLHINGDASLVIFGVGLLTVLAVAPRGIAGIGETVLHRLGSHRTKGANHA